MDRDLVELASRGDREAFAILARSRGDRPMLTTAAADDEPVFRQILATFRFAPPG